MIDKQKKRRVRRIRYKSYRNVYQEKSWQKKIIRQIRPNYFSNDLFLPRNFLVKVLVAHDSKYDFPWQKQKITTRKRFQPTDLVDGGRGVYYRGVYICVTLSSIYYMQYVLLYRFAIIYLY